MPSMKCYTCVHFDKAKKQGRIKTSKACHNWQPDWEILSSELKKAHRYISRLTQTSFVIFKKYWKEERINIGFDLGGQRCGACIYFDKCELKPRRKDVPYTFDCKEWDLDLERKRTSKYCQKELRLLVRIFANQEMYEEELVYVDHFIKMQEIVNEVRSEQEVSVAVGDKYSIRIGGKKSKCKVVKLTPENVVLSNGSTEVHLLYSSIKDSTQCVKL